MSFREVLGWHGRREWGLALLDAAVIAMAQAHLWTIFLQVEQLLAVERSSTLPGRNDGSKPTQCSKCSKIGSFYSIFTTLNPNFTGYTNLLSNELDSIFIFHPTFYQCERHQDRSSAGRQNLLKTWNFIHYPRTFSFTMMGEKSELFYYYYAITSQRSTEVGKTSNFPSVKNWKYIKVNFITSLLKRVTKPQINSLIFAFKPHCITFIKKKIYIFFFLQIC